MAVQSSQNIIQENEIVNNKNFYRFHNIFVYIYQCLNTQNDCRNLLKLYKHSLSFL